MTPDHRAYRSAAELLATVRDHHRLTQQQLADRSGVHQTQLARYEKGIAEPTLPVLRRILDSVGWAPTLGIEPTTAALDEALGVADELGGPVLDTDVQLLLRVCAKAGEAGARIVVGGEVAAALQGVPTRSTELEVLVLESDLETLLTEAHRAHRPVERPDPRDDHGEADWLLWVGYVPARVRVVQVLPAARPVVLGELRLHAVDLDVLMATGALGPAAAALAARRSERTGTPG
ncbi:MAG: helix-turn-helix domain-containing protein, partial [Actinomycetota bacterium]|nr:helix-turn-helix domain-containing protein [Actinomycetota bacterium]